ncbi:MAG: hypothetical protein JSV09_03345 [Thermoplasmata archaeon]|nr:MAG: hypothetical protein JSV09_03345 [Thermoplasmata archaeon]
MGLIAAELGEIMDSDYIYEEKIFAKVIGGILGSVMVLMLVIMMYQIIAGPLGDDPAPTLFFLIMFLIFLMLTLIFSRLIIRMTFQSITVGFGIIKRTIPWENISAVRIDETSAIKYGGAGIRMAKVQGKWVLVYNVIGGPRCVLTLKEGRFKEFIFSTKNPEEVINVVTGQIVLK